VACVTAGGRDSLSVSRFVRNTDGNVVTPYLPCGSPSFTGTRSATASLRRSSGASEWFSPRNNAAPESHPPVGHIAF
jgi:hypothetical protein